MGIRDRKYVSNVDHFLVANRGVDVYLGIASLAATEFGIATCMANAELGFKYGLKGIIPGIALGGSMFVVGLTGFCIEPLRNMAVITVPELFERKFGKKIRWASGLVILIGGLLNMGLFLRQAGSFLSITMGIGEGYLELLMTAILLFVGCYTVIGGMVSVLVTDYIQFILMCLGFISITAILIYQFGWQSILDQSKTYLGPDSLSFSLNSCKYRTSVAAYFCCSIVSLPPQSEDCSFLLSGSAGRAEPSKFVYCNSPRRRPLPSSCLLYSHPLQL